MTAKITVLLADDHEIVRQGLCALLDADGQCCVTGQARTGHEAVQLAATLRPDVILMDIAMPELNGMEATRQILAANPAARVIMLSAHCDAIYVERMIGAGARGFVEKQVSAEFLTKAISEVAQGRRFFGPGAARRLCGGLPKLLTREGVLRVHPRRLTAREAEVLRRVAEGATNKQIGRTLGISVKTIEKHRQRLMDKLDVHETAGLTRYAIAAGIVESEPRLVGAG